MLDENALHARRSPDRSHHGTGAHLRPPITAQYQRPSTRYRPAPHHLHESSYRGESKARTARPPSGYAKTYAQLTSQHQRTSDASISTSRSIGACTRSTAAICATSSTRTSRQPTPRSSPSSSRTRVFATCSACLPSSSSSTRRFGSSSTTAPNPCCARGGTAHNASADDHHSPSLGDSVHERISEQATQALLGIAQRTNRTGTAVAKRTGIAPGKRTRPY